VAVIALTAAKVLFGTAWTGTAPGPPGTQTVSGTITASTDLSFWGKSLATPEAFEALDASGFGSGGFRNFTPGMSAMDASITFFQDFAAGATYATLSAVTLAKTLTYWDVNPTQSARGATNPSLVFAAYMTQFDFLTAATGEVAEVTVGLKVTGKWAHLIA
jgi:hypothetical protein